MARSASLAADSIQPKIDKEFANLLPPLTTEEREGLRELLVENAWQGTAKVWAGHGILLDGHHRIELCDEEGIAYKSEGVDLLDRNAAKLWITRHALGQRNSTPEQKSYLRGKQYELEKKQGKRTRPSGEPAKSLAGSWP